MNSQENKPETPAFGTKKTRGLFKLSPKSLQDLRGVVGYEISEKDFIDPVIGDHLQTSIVYKLINVIKKSLPEEGRFSAEAEFCFKKILFFSTITNELMLKMIGAELKKIIIEFASEPAYLQKFYDLTCQHFDQSQLSKLQEAYFGRDSSLEDVEKRKIFLIKLIDLLTGHGKTKKLNIGDSPAFLCLERSAKEAVCWKELESSRSGNVDYARLAGVVAWKNWLYKEPLLKEFCSLNKIDYLALSPSQKASLLKKAVKYFPKEQIATIIDLATEVEIDRRKRISGLETNPKLVNKRVSMGLELEMGKPPFSNTVNYAWHENLERSLSGDKMVYEADIEEAFQKLVSIKDQEKLVDSRKAFLDDAKLTLKLFLNKSKDVDQKKLIDDLARGIVSNVLDEATRAGLIQWLDGNAVTQEFLELMNKYWQVKLDAASLDLRQMQVVFDSLFLNKKPAENFYNTQSAYLKSLPTGEFPNFAQQMLDAFRHHMGQIQIFGHGIDSDAFGEYQLIYTSGNLKQPYRSCLREIWELAKTDFHDLNVKSRPVHVTIGWREDLLARDVVISYKDAKGPASLLNFALFAAGYANPDFIDELEQKDNQLMDEKSRHAVVNSLVDTGRSRVVRERLLNMNRQGSSRYSVYAIEFRAFSPGGDINQIRLLESLGKLGTAMKANLFINSMAREKSFAKIDDVDKKLNRIWYKFSSKVKKIHSQYGDIPPLLDANLWLSRTDEGPNLQFDPKKISRFYLKLIKEKNKQNGLVRQMRRIIAETALEVEEVLN